MRDKARHLMPSTARGRIARWTTARSRLRRRAAHRALTLVRHDQALAGVHPQLSDVSDPLAPGEPLRDAVNLPHRSGGSLMDAASVVLKRTLSLSSDAILLTLASPFFLAWWAVRAVRRWTIKS